jgi:hypothetical protein
MDKIYVSKIWDSCKIKKHFTVDLEDDIVIILPGNKYYLLEDSAADIWKYLSITSFDVFYKKWSKFMILILI